MANEDFSDVSGTYTPEPDPVAVADAAAKLAEQMRLEEEAALRALPLQRQEQASDYAAWKAGGSRPGDVQPILPLKYGSRMPTSQGYMYMGNPVAGPAPGSPLAATRAYEGAMMRQNIPAANEAYQQLSGMDIVPRGTLAGINRDVPMPAPTRAEQQYEAMQRFYKLREAGIPTSEAMADSGVWAFPGNLGSRPMSEYQAVSTGLRREALQQQAAQNEARQRLAEQKASVPTRDPLLRSQILKLGEDISSMEKDMEFSEPTEAQLRDLASKRERLQQLTDQYNGTPSTRTATLAPQVVAPAGTTNAVAPPIGRGAPRQATAASEVIRKVGGRKAVFDSKTKKFLRYAD